MGTPLLVTGDLAVFPTVFGVALVPAPLTAPVVGSGQAKVGVLAVCVAGDEASVVVACTYMAGAFTVPGTGMLTIESLATDQSSQGVSSGNKAALLARSKFVAKLQVIAGAANPAGVLDTVPTYTGEGEFQSSNVRASASF